MAARWASICRRYSFQQIENQHLVGHSMSAGCLRLIFKSLYAIGDFSPTPCGGTMLNTLAN